MDEKTNTQVVDTVDTTNNEVETGAKTFTQDDLDNLASKVRAEEKKKTDKAIKDAIAEYDRQAKLTEEEREKEAKTKREAELRDRENSITLRERKLQAQEILASKNVPMELADLVVNLDEETTKANIEVLTKAYNKSVENGVTNKLKGQAPVDFSVDNKADSSTTANKNISRAF